MPLVTAPVAPFQLAEFHPLQVLPKGLADERGSVHANPLGGAIGGTQ